MNGMWKLQSIIYLVPFEVFERNRDMPTPHFSTNDDLVIWTRDLDKSFYSRRAYYLIKDLNNKMVKDKLQWI